MRSSCTSCLRFFTHTDETDEQLELLISAAFEMMG